MPKKNSAAERRERKQKIMAKLVAKGVEFNKFRGKSEATKMYQKHYIKARAALS